MVIATIFTFNCCSYKGKIDKNDSCQRTCHPYKFRKMQYSTEFNSNKSFRYYNLKLSIFFQWIVKLKFHNIFYLFYVQLAKNPCCQGYLKSLPPFTCTWIILPWKKEIFFDPRLLRSNLRIFSVAKVWCCLGFYIDLPGVVIWQHIHQSMLHSSWEEGLTRFQLPKILLRPENIECRNPSDILECGPGAILIGNITLIAP